MIDKTLATEIPVTTSFLGATAVPLDEMDPFLLESFREIQRESCSNKEPFFVCVVQENKHFFYFHGPSFLEGYLRSRRNFRNPYTKERIVDFEFLIGSGDEAGAKHFMMREFLEQTPNYCLPIGTDVYRDPVQRSRFLRFLGNHMAEVGRLRTSLHYLDKAARLGHPKVSLVLAEQFSKGTHGFERNLQQAVRYYQCAAVVGNNAAIAQMVKCWERGLGVPKNAIRSKAWRRCLPDWIRLGEIDSIINILVKKPKWKKQKRDIEVPAELLVDILPLINEEDGRLHSWHEKAPEALQRLSLMMNLDVGSYMEQWKTVTKAAKQTQALNRWRKNRK